MDSGIPIVFVPIPFVFWVWHLKQIIVKQTRLFGAVSLALGIGFVLAFVLPYESTVTLKHDLMLVGLLYIPFYLVLVFIVSRLLRMRASSRNNKTKRV